MRAERASDRAGEALPVPHPRRRVIPRVAVGAAATRRPFRRVGEVRPDGDVMPRCKGDERVQPREVVLAARRLVVIPPDTASPGSYLEFLEERDVRGDLGEVVAL